MRHEYKANNEVLSCFFVRLMFRRFYGSEVEGGEEGNGSNKNKYEYVEPIESYDDLEVVLKEKTDMMERVSIIREVLDLFEEKIDNKQSTTSYVPVRGEDGMMKLITTEHETEVVVQLGRIILRCLIEPVENKGELILIKQYEESKKSMEAEAEARKDAPPITNLKKKEKVEKRWEAGLFSLNNLKEKIRFWRGLSLAEAYVIGVIRKFSTDARALQSRLCAALSNRDFYKPAEYRDLLLSVTEAMEKKNLTPREQVNELKSLF